MNNSQEKSSNKVQLLEKKKSMDDTELDKILEQSKSEYEQSVISTSKLRTKNKNVSTQSKEWIPVFSHKSNWYQSLEFFLFIVTYGMFILYIIEIFYQVNVLDKGWVDQTVKGLIFFFFVAQIILKFNTSIYTKGNETLDRKLIRQNYIKQGLNGRFFWDCISILGLLINTFSVTFPGQWITYFLFFTKVVFMAEFDNFIREFLHLNRRTLAAYELARLLLVVLFISNLAACIFYNIGINTFDIYNVNWISGIPYPPATDSIALIYLYSLYWSIGTMTTVAYGDVVPLNPLETIYTCFIMFIAAVVIGYTINQIIEIIEGMYLKEVSAQKYLSAMSRYMQIKNISTQLRNKIKEYMRYQLKDEKLRDKEAEQEIIERLPPNLKAELFYEVNTFFFKYFPWTNKFSEQFISALSFDIQESIFLEETILHDPTFIDQEDDVNLYYIAKGKVEVLQDIPEVNNGNGVHLHLIEENNFIGLPEFMSGKMIKQILRFKTDGKAFIIHRNKFLEIISHFSQDKKLWNAYVKMVCERKQYFKFGLFCYNCQSEEHLIDDCELNKKKENLFDKTKKSMQQRSNRFVSLMHSDSAPLNEEDDDKNSKIMPPVNQDNIIEEHQQNKELNSVKKQGEIDFFAHINKGTEQSLSIDPNKRSSDENFHFMNRRHTTQYNPDSSHKRHLIEIQEKEIEKQLENKIYHESESGKWQSRARIKEIITRKTQLEQRRKSGIYHQINKPAKSKEEVLIQVLQSVQAVLKQNNMDFNELISLTNEEKYAQRLEQSQKQTQNQSQQLGKSSSSN